MITIAAVLARIPDLDAATLDLWVAQQWVRPQRQSGQWQFAEIDIARLHLIVELRGPLEVGDAAIPVVLSLLDQLHDARRQVRQLGAMLDGTASGAG